MSKRAREIAEAVKAHGALTKKQILTAWPMDEYEYQQLQQEMRNYSGIVPGPQRSGGFRVRITDARASSELAELTPLPVGAVTSKWEQATIDRLAVLFQHSELEQLLGRLLYTVRLARKDLTGSDRRGSKVEIAHALLIQHGIDLFREMSIRRAVADKCGVDCPEKWHPSKSKAVDFVEQAGFPPELAGIPSDDPPEAFEYLEGRIDIQDLQDFQDEVKRRLLPYLDKSNGRAVLTLPTGAGKTRVAVQTIRDWLSLHYASSDRRIGTVLWLAHSSELCDQAYSEFRQMWRSSSDVCPLLLIRFYGRFADVAANRDTLSDISTRPAVLVSTPQKFRNLIRDTSDASQAFKADLSSRLSIVVIDEAHRAAAPIYQEILTYADRVNLRASVIGLTATPFRVEYAEDSEAGTIALAKLFTDLIEPLDTLGIKPREILQERGILARPIVRTIKTKTEMESPVFKSDAELTDEDIGTIDQALCIRADNPQRRQLILRHIVDFCKQEDSAVLYFGPSVIDSQCMAYLLRLHGIASAAVSGDTRDVSRRKIISDFKAGKLRVLCNCEVLTTGFDAPRVTHVVMARPTVSQVLYEQMVGRGLRGKRFGGTDCCVIVDCEDNYRSERPTLGYHAFRHLWNVSPV